MFATAIIHCHILSASIPFQTMHVLKCQCCLSGRMVEARGGMGSTGTWLGLVAAADRFSAEGGERRRGMALLPVLRGCMRELRGIVPWLKPALLSDTAPLGVGRVPPNPEHAAAHALNCLTACCKFVASSAPTCISLHWSADFATYII